jgi:hypothetical protein
MILLKELLKQPQTGVPLKHIVFRGDDIEFNDFNPSFIGKSTMSNTEGFWFSSSKDTAQYFGEHVRKFEITMNNPLVFTDEEFSRGYPKGPPEFARIAKRKGHDGVVILNIVDGDRISDVYCVWNISQIKKL